MVPVLDTLAVYMKPIGVKAFGDALYRVTDALDKLCRQVNRMPLTTLITQAKLTAPGPIHGWTLPDALWLTACKRSPEINFYPMGEIAERAFKRTIIWLAFFAGQDQPYDLDTDLKILQKHIRNTVTQYKGTGVLAFFLTEYLYEVCRDSERRLKTYTKTDPCYRYHFPNGRKPRSIAEEMQAKRILLEHCRKLSDDCLPALLKSLAENNPTLLDDELSKMYLRSVGKPPKVAKTRGSRKPHLNVVVGNKPWSELKREYALDPKVMRFLLHSKKANITFDYAVVENILARMLDRKTFRLHSLSKDLLDIGVVIYMADQAVKRERTLKRRLDILMPVRNLKVWIGLQEPLAEAVSFLGRDEVHFHFMKKKEKVEPIKFKITPGKQCVSLFSGGLDSVAGAVQVLNDGLEPVFVSQHANALTSSLQKNLMHELNQNSGRSPAWLSLFIGRSLHKHVSSRFGNFPRSPMTQFLRSFMFLSIASVVALEAGIDKVFVFENGPIALNPMFSEARLNTRTAHPRFLAGFQILIETLFKVKLEIHNPFLFETKGEVVSRLAKPGYRNLVQKTNSCWNSFAVPIRAKKMNRTDHVYHDDGDCLPCVIRKASIAHVEFADQDVPYLIDVFKEFPVLEMKTQVLIADYLRFCINLGMLNDATLLLEHPDFSVCAPGVNPEELISMYRRHAKEMIATFRKLGSSATVRSVLPLPK